MGLFNGQRIENLEQSVQDLSNKSISIECKILQPELLRPKDVLVFQVRTDSVDLSETQLLALKQKTEEYLSNLGIENKVVYLNNVDLRIVSSIIT